MSTQDKLADALRAFVTHHRQGGRPYMAECIRKAEVALAAHDAQPAPVLEKWEIDSMQTLADALEKRGDDLSTYSASWLRKYLMLAAAPQPAPAPVQVDDHIRKLVGKLDQWRSCMSYNDSYFGEPAGLVKSTIRDLAKAVDPIYPIYPPKSEPVDPLAGVTIHTATVPLSARPPATAADGVVELPPLPNTAESVAANVLRGMGYQWKNGTWAPYLPNVAPGSGSGEGAHNRLAAIASQQESRNGSEGEGK